MRVVANDNQDLCVTDVVLYVKHKIILPQKDNNDHNSEARASYLPQSAQCELTGH